MSSDFTSVGCQKVCDSEKDMVEQVESKKSCYSLFEPIWRVKRGPLTRYVEGSEVRRPFVEVLIRRISERRMEHNKKRKSAQQVHSEVHGEFYF